MSLRLYNSVVLKTIVIAIVLYLGIFSVVSAGETVTVFSAGSTINAMTDIRGLYMGSHTEKVVTSFASSSTLAKQIDNGAPADIYLSANAKWMDYLEQKQLIETGSRIDLLSNRIVLIASVTGAIQHIEVTSGFPLADLLADGRLAMGDPGHVPAGIYGKQAFQNLGIWDSIVGKLAPMKDVRAALTLVERGEVPLGQVYATDAAISSKVRVVGTFPAGSHPSIVYPVAIMVGHRNPAVERFMDFLGSSESRAVFVRYGFKVR